MSYCLASSDFFPYFIHQRLKKKKNLLIPSVSPLIGDEMGFQGLKWRALIGLGTKSGKKKMLGLKVHLHQQKIIIIRLLYLFIFQIKMSLKF